MIGVTNFEQSEFIANHFDTNSADMSWVQIYDEDHMITDYELRMIPYKLNKRRYIYRSVPAWSLEALMKLFPTAAYIDIKLEQDSFGFWRCIFKYETEGLVHRTVTSDKNGKSDVVGTVFEMLKWLVENTKQMSFMQMNPLFKYSLLYKDNEANNK